MAIVKLQSQVNGICRIIDAHSNPHILELCNATSQTANSMTERRKAIPGVSSGRGKLCFNAHIIC